MVSTLSTYCIFSVIRRIVVFLNVSLIALNLLHQFRTNDKHIRTHLDYCDLSVVNIRS